MRSWLLRGIVMAAVHIAGRVLLGAAILARPFESPLLRLGVLAVLVAVAALWGGFDGVRDARAHPDPDDAEDLTLRWLKAGALAGVVASLTCWILGTFGVDGIGPSGFVTEMVAGTSFLTLLVYVPAFLGAAAGRFVVRRVRRRTEEPVDA
ncbi:MAG: B-4DMT family transporter [Gordonia sp. (in: high G+C Gram-positive bacteria)]|uniref:B-4DMT family transporter n=1 Tax=Gordonia sp. (in: high G+C Gram-positive bacteria) TaxID=84139 RepID=UPI0039E2E0A5